MTKTFWPGEVYTVGIHGKSRILTVGKRSLFMRDTAGKEFVIGKEILSNIIEEEERRAASAVVALERGEAKFLRKGDYTYDMNGGSPWKVRVVGPENVSFETESGRVSVTSFKKADTYHFVKREVKERIQRDACKAATRILRESIEYTEERLAASVQSVVDARKALETAQEDVSRCSEDLLELREKLSEKLSLD